MIENEKGESISASQACAPGAGSLHEKRAAGEVETLAGVQAVSHAAAPCSAGEEADMGCAALKGSSVGWDEGSGFLMGQDLAMRSLPLYGQGSTYGLPGHPLASDAVLVDPTAYHHCFGCAQTQRGRHQGWPQVLLLLSRI